MSIRRIMFCIVYAIISGFFRTIFYWFSSDTMTVTHVVLDQSFSWFYPIVAMQVDLSIQYAPFLIFQVLFAGNLSNHFQRSGVFFFSRQTNRTRWFFRECGSMAGYCGIYTVSFLIVCLMIANVTGGLAWDEAGLLAMIYFCFLVGMWLFFHCLMLDLIAIHGGIILGFVVSSILQFGYISLYSFCQSLNQLGDGMIGGEELPNWLTALVWGNPFSHLILCWHKSGYEMLGNQIDYYGIGIDLNVSLIAFAVAIVVLIGLGNVSICRKDIL